MSRTLVGTLLVLGLVAACSEPDVIRHELSSSPDSAVESRTDQTPEDDDRNRDSADESDTRAERDILLARAAKPFFGDLAEIRERRLLRVLVSYSKTSFFYDFGQARGFEVELAREYEKSLNQGAANVDRVRVVFLPTPFDRLLDELGAGRGDIAAAGLTVTPERRRQVAFAAPFILDAKEVVVTGRGGPEIGSLEDLAGLRMLVRKGSSYVAHLEALSARLEAEGLEPIQVLEADSRLVTEDLLEMVSAGAIGLSVADRHIAEAWAEVLPDLEVRDDLVIHAGSDIAWAVRPDCEDLLASLDAFVAKHEKGSFLGNIFFKRYYASSKWISNPVSPEERAKLEEHIALFQKYAARYDFDWLALAAQAYQESGLDQSRTSLAGAVGVMQLLPTTAADKNVAVADIHLLENNIHAGTKYLAFLRDRYFSDEGVEPAVRVDFAWAAYNAGPARVRRLRSKAEGRGLDPDKWFDNVERIAAEEIGRETVDYVANINKYYVAYKLQYEASQERQVARASSG